MKGQALFVILFIVAIMVVASFGEYRIPERTVYSSRNREPPGCLAFYLLLEKYTAVERVETDLTTVNLEPGTFLMISPARLLSPEEQERLFMWVEQGNNLVVFSQSPQIMQQFGAKLFETEYTYAFLTPLRDHWSTSHVKSIYIFYSYYFSSDVGDALFADGGKRVIIEIERGTGQIFLISDPSLVQNTRIDELDNEIFLVHLAFSDKVYFDEYHQYTPRVERGVTWGSFTAPFTSRYALFFIQFLLTLALLFIAHGKRFGAPRPVIPREVQSSELVVSAADLYYRARKKEVLEILGEN